MHLGDKNFHRVNHNYLLILTRPLIIVHQDFLVDNSWVGAYYCKCCIVSGSLKSLFRILYFFSFLVYPGFVQNMDQTGRGCRKCLGNIGSM